jgi:hypothetical protein
MPQRSASFADGLARRTLGADEQQRAAVGGELRMKSMRLAIERQALLEIDDVDLVALAEDEG